MNRRAVTPGGSAQPCDPEAGVEDGGPAGVEVLVWLEAGVDVGGPAGVVWLAWLDPGVDDGGPAGVEWLAWSEPDVERWLDPGFDDDVGWLTDEIDELAVPPGMTPVQYWLTLSPAAVAAAIRFLKATELLLMWPPLAA